MDFIKAVVLNIVARTLLTLFFLCFAIFAFVAPMTCMNVVEEIARLIAKKGLKSGSQKVV